MSASTWHDRFNRMVAEDRWFEACRLINEVGLRDRGGRRFTPRRLELRVHEVLDLEVAPRSESASR